ncbi:unnamed protein product [Mytilus coruscus]|uniref:CCHC-type domain-containing protein n=1 Tax=Mytilus coruscus TaxID=42192 RepID=A0A6J8CJI6_MYTCO|nr:unnamed protein product [Mytilus coruscus]
MTVRFSGFLTDCQSGDRIFYVQPLKGTLPRFTKTGKYNAKIYYKGQIYINPYITCQKCLKKGHKQEKCQNYWDSNQCGKEGHRAKECQTSTLTTTASDTDVNNNNDQSDSSESESGDETDIGDHVDHSEIPPSQSILQPTDAITETSTDIIEVTNTETESELQEKKQKKKDKTKNKAKSEAKGPIDKFIVNSGINTPLPRLQKHRKRTATTPTDEYHNRETDSSKASKT